MNLKILCLAAISAVSTALAAVNFPFPQMSSYAGATLLSNKVTASEQLKSAFSYWKSAFYNEQGNIAGVRSNEGSSEYFSEGIGYGMLLMVYFSDNTTSYQAEFDKLWNCYKKFEDENGLMNWKIGNLSEVWDKGAALDGDVDAAAALIMAAYQFGDTKYLDEARTLIKAMKAYEFESNGLHLPGDKWNEGGLTRKNPGYFDPAYMPLFAAVDTDNAEFWQNTAYEANMKLYETSSNEVSTGLIDDWTNQYGKSEDDYYSYDASRAPWRNAKAVCWFNDARALAIDKKMAAFVSKVKASQMKGPVIRSSGSLGNDHNSTFVTSLMTAFVSSASYQAKLDEYWAEAVNLGNENYFNQSLKLLNGLLVSGNMPNLAAGTLTPITPVAPTNPDSSASIKQMQNVNNARLMLNGNVLEIFVTGAASVNLVSVTGNVEQNIYVNGYANVDLSKLPKGVYIAHIKSKNFNAKQKILLK